MQEHSAARLPSYYLSHGGGPWPWMMQSAAGGAASPFAELDRSIKAMRRELGERPRAVLVVSAHWEEPVFTFSSAATPPMIYDYYNFPEAMYAIRYDAPGSPDTALKAAELLAAGGMPVQVDPQRGFDHGTFSLMKALYPDADMPIAQMSIRADYDAQAHLDAGRMLAPLRDQGVLIIGSGLSFHNMRLLGPAGRDPSRLFDSWRQDALVNHAAQDRAQMLANWSMAPAARVAHPREDHLLPLMVAEGAASQDAGQLTYHEDHFLGGVAASSFQFGAMPA